MANSRQRFDVEVWGGRAVFSRRLFEPETTDLMGQPLRSPSYSIVVIILKTRPNWWEEPLLQDFLEACDKVILREGMDRNHVQWPVKDGDLPNTKNEINDWSRGHWVLRASTSYGEQLEIGQRVNGVRTEIPSLKIGDTKWGDGDYCRVSMQLAKRMNDNVGIRCYLKGVEFYDQGKEISRGQQTNWDAGYQRAQQQGLVVRNGPRRGYMGGGGPPQQGYRQPQQPGYGAPPQGYGQPQYQQPPQQHMQGAGGPPPQGQAYGQPQQPYASQQPPQAFGAPPQPQQQPPQSYGYYGQAQPGQPPMGAGPPPQGQMPAFNPQPQQPPQQPLQQPQQPTYDQPNQQWGYGHPPQDMTQAYRPGDWRVPAPDDDIPF